jgi:murein DD-endopeptidase MepM/ murein hydrolase activator NlpD
MRTPRPSRKPALLIAVALVAFGLQPGAAAASRRRPASRPVSLDVQPSPEIDAQVADEVAKAQGILDNLTTANLLASPYLVSAIYYHDGFLTALPGNRGSASPERRIIGQISDMLTAERKARFVSLLHELWSQSGQSGPKVTMKPVVYSAVGGGRRTHQYAVDLFAHEGTPVHAVSRGIVVLADRDWSPENLFSTASRKGGNAVILFDPDQDRFYRFCHLSTVQATVGEAVAAGQIVGTVGHSGLTASQPGHGGHLHFETNEYLQGHVRAIDNRRLRAMLRQWPSLSAESKVDLK